MNTPNLLQTSYFLLGEVPIKSPTCSVAIGFQMTNRTSASIPLNWDLARNLVLYPCPKRCTAQHSNLKCLIHVCFEASRSPGGHVVHSTSLTNNTEAPQKLRCGNVNVPFDCSFCSTYPHETQKNFTKQSVLRTKHGTS